MSAGYAITTYKLQLCYKHLDWFKQTQSLFDAVLAFYYEQLDQNPRALSLTNQNLLRHLELKTIPQRNGTQIKSHESEFTAPSGAKNHPAAERHPAGKSTAL